MGDIEQDLNATIAAAVKAKVEASVMEALAGGELMREYVAAALSQQVDLNPNDRYNNKKVSFLERTLRTAIQKATEDAVRAAILEDMPVLQDEVRRAIKRNSSTMADALCTSLTEAAERAYGVKVELNMPGRG